MPSPRQVLDQVETLFNRGGFDIAVMQRRGALSRRRVLAIVEEMERLAGELRELVEGE